MFSMYTIRFDWWELMFIWESVTLPDLLNQLKSFKFVCGYFYSASFWFDEMIYHIHWFWAIASSRIISIEPFKDKDWFIDCMDDDLKDPKWQPILSYTC